MTSPRETRGRQALAALAELARGSVQPPTPAELDGGLDALRSRMDAQAGGRRAPAQSLRHATVFRWSLVGTLAAISVLVTVGVRSGLWRASEAQSTLT